MGGLSPMSGQNGAASPLSEASRRSMTDILQVIANKMSPGKFPDRDKGSHEQRWMPKWGCSVRLCHMCQGCYWSTVHSWPIRDLPCRGESETREDLREIVMNVLNSNLEDGGHCLSIPKYTATQSQTFQDTYFHRLQIDSIV